MGFELRCFQLLSLPNLATQLCTWQYNWYTRGWFTLILSYKGQLSSRFDACGRYGPTCLTTVWTQLTNHFNWRTAKPLGPSTAPGCDEPTSRCRTVPLIWTLGHYQPVIPGVTFVWWSPTVLRTMVGSLSSAFASARHTRLAVKPALPFTGPIRFPSGSSRPLNFSVTF